MKGIFKILVCLVLGTMATSCFFTDEEIVSIAPDTPVLCEPANETHYSVYYQGSGNARLSTLAPYIYEDESKEESDIVDAYCVGDYLYMYENQQDAKFYTKDGINFLEETYKVSLFFDTYIVRYHFVVVLPSVCSPECKHYSPSFEFVDCVTKELGDEEMDGKLYYCTEATVTLRVRQGEEVFDFVKTVKLRQEYVDVTINIGINPGFEGENNTEI